MPKQVPATPSAPTAIGPYSPATEANGFVFVSGQVGVDPATGDTAPEAGDQTRQIMDNIGAILGDVGLAYSDVVKATIFLTDMADFPVVNEAYGSYFPDDPPARSTVQVAALPRPQFNVEIEVIAAR